MGLETSSPCRVLAALKGVGKNVLTELIAVTLARGAVYSIIRCLGFD